MSDQGSTVRRATEAAGPGDARPPVADLATETDATAIGRSLEFDGTDSYDPDGHLARHEWAIEHDDEVIAGDAGATFAHTFDRPGTHRVHLTVTDGDGCWDTATEVVAVEAADEATPR